MTYDPLQPKSSESTGTADGRSPETQINDSLETVADSFHWLGTQAMERLSQLGADLAKTDEPPWYEHVLMSLVEVALGAGAAGVGEFLATKLVTKLLPGVEEAGHEFIKAMFEDGLNTGIEAGRHQLAAHHGSGNVETFIGAQKDAVLKTHIQNQAHFRSVGRHQVKTVERAQQLAAACQADHVKGAADAHYIATRDAWVSYLAQAKFGAIGKHGLVHAGDANFGPTTTDLASAEHRKKVNEGAEGYAIEDAPSLFGAIVRRDVPGVLEMMVTLPSIESNRMAGTPKVEVAALNGVNQTIRRQYAGKPVGEMHIPRQITAKVEGDRPDFMLSLNEAGGGAYVPQKQASWLRARSLVGDHPENATKDDYERMEAGIELLLGELVPEAIF